jgi:hypothetical protein
MKRNAPRKNRQPDREHRSERDRLDASHESNTRGNIVMPMRIKLKRNSKPVATAMTSNVPSPANARDRPGGGADLGRLRREGRATDFDTECYTVSAF